MSQNIVFEPNMKILLKFVCHVPSRLVLNKPKPCRFISKTHIFIETSKILQIFKLKSSFFSRNCKIKTIRNIVFKNCAKNLCRENFLP